MIPQGSTLINTETFTSITESVNSANSCAELQAIVSSAMASVNVVKDNISSELAKLTPILAITTPPGANLGAIVTWITDFISTTVTPMVKPTITYADQLTATAAQIASLTAAINAASAKFPSCSITIPS